MRRTVRRAERVDNLLMTVTRRIRCCILLSKFLLSLSLGSLYLSIPIFKVPYQNSPVDIQLGDVGHRPRPGLRGTFIRRVHHLL